MISDAFAKQFGMRGRLWWLWGCQTIAGVLCVGLGLAYASFTNTMIVLCIFSFFVQVRPLAEPKSGQTAWHSGRARAGLNAGPCCAGPLCHGHGAQISVIERVLLFETQALRL